MSNTKDYSGQPILSIGTNNTQQTKQKMQTEEQYTVLSGCLMTKNHFYTMVHILKIR